jgi:two-component system sensor kinase FixL
MGVGLSISRTIVEAHRGRIWFESVKSGGTAFHFTLPLAE